MSMFMQLEEHKSAHVGSDPSHQGWIPLIAVELGMSRSRKVTGTGESDRRVGQAGAASISVRKELDSSTGYISQALMQGNPLGKVVVDICESNKGKFVRRLMRYTIEEANIAHYRVIRGEEQGGSLEEIVLIGSKIAMEHNL